MSVYHCVSPTEDGVLGVTEDGGERALTGARVTRGEGATDAARALLRVSGGAVAMAGPEVMEHGAVVPSRSPRSHSVCLSGTKCSKALNLHLLP